MRNDLGSAHGSVPSRPSPSACVIGETQREFHVPLSWEKCRPTLRGPAPAKLGSLGWTWALGKTVHFSGTEALPHVIPHMGSKLGTPAQRWAMKKHVAAPWRVGQCLQLNASPLGQKGAKYYTYMGLLGKCAVLPRWRWHGAPCDGIALASLRLALGGVHCHHLAGWQVV